jgi:hypothetical protein
MKLTCYYWIAFISLLWISACSKKDDASDVSDNYVGIYTLTDTVIRTYSFPNPPDTTIYNSSASIAKVSSNVVKLNQFPRQACDSLEAQVSETSLVLLSRSGCGDFPTNFLCQRQGNTLYYTYDVDNLAWVFHVKGKAVKQT